VNVAVVRSLLEWHGPATCGLVEIVMYALLKANGVATLAQNKIFPVKQELLLS
jgi:hypothetical protein